MSNPAAPAGERVNLEEKLSLFASHWDPKIVGELNGQHVKLVKIQGSFTGDVGGPRTVSQPERI